MESFIELIRADGSTERHRIDGAHATVGRSPAAGVSLPGIPGIEPEHMQVQPRVDGCWVAIAKGLPPARVGGAAFEQGILPWGTELELGAARLRLVNDLDEKKKKKGDKKTSPLVFVAAAAVPLFVWLFLDDESESMPPAPRAPEMEAVIPPVNACPAAGAAAENLAGEQMEIADAKAERYAFEAQDGISAARQFGIANRCFAAVNRPEEAGRAERKRAQISHRIENDMRNSRLRLERAMRFERWEEALRATARLQEITRHMDTPYTQYLNVLARSLDAKIAAAAAPED